jgi:hypothetical protein
MHTTTNTGLHEFVAERVLTRYARSGIRAADLGSGPGAMAARLHTFGCEVLPSIELPKASKLACLTSSSILIGMTLHPS